MRGEFKLADFAEKIGEIIIAILKDIGEFFERIAEFFEKML